MSPSFYTVPILSFHLAPPLSNLILPWFDVKWLSSPTIQLLNKAQIRLEVNLKYQIFFLVLLKSESISETLRCNIITYHHYVNVDIIWMLCAGQSVTRITCAVRPPCSVLTLPLTLCSRPCLSPSYQRPPPSGPRTPITAAPPQLAWPCQWRWLRPSERLLKYRLIHEQVPGWLSSYSFERYVSDIRSLSSKSLPNIASRSRVVCG